MQDMELVKAIKVCFTKEQKMRDRSGLYGYTQRVLAYNSNKIEGSTLTPEQTALLFEEGFLPATEDYYRAKDVEEMNGHFLMFNYTIKTIDDRLSEDLVKALHYELKAGVFEDRANGYAIGDYKKRPNTVGGISTVLPSKVATEMKKLIDWYNSIESVSIHDLAVLHVEYEKIHPFQDGNGRAGRMLLFRECLRNEIMPFIVLDENRMRYIQCLRKAQENKDVTDLVNYFRIEQEVYREACVYFDVAKIYGEGLRDVDVF
ncbi:Fic family protein [Acetivibrio ethanolgignens]|uniref:Cell filamentation protein Fic n=1 Tax=Acetivibrio ethanolgignens TaxID=290052 RepID=A0A0V8QDS7_9FIRM|nr:Fic family protein [Acetivibrio ethanolgignens]KSV58749.1 cell filamentation protein Fic [Acetivibrio ethanolgignens]